MNWSKLKSGLIFLLVLLNIGLLLTLFLMERTDSSKIKEMIPQSVAVLQKNGITIDPARIPFDSEASHSIGLTAAIKDGDKFASMLLGKDYTKHTESDSGTTVYQREKETIRLNGGYVKYYSNRAVSEALSEKELHRTVKHELNRLGFDLSSAVLRTQSETTVVLDARFAELPFFEGTLSVSADKQGIVTIEGFWMEPHTDFGQSSGSVAAAPTVFPKFISDPGRSASSTEITSVTLGYSVLLGEPFVNYSEATAIPAWRITTSDGKSYFYDADQ